MSRLVAVTGATGFIGGHVLRALAEEGIGARALARRLPHNPVTEGTRFEAVLGDLDDAASLRRLVRGTDAVVHLAGAIKARRRADFFRYNAAAVGNLAQALKEENSGARLVYLSSLAAREPGLSSYAASKRAGEQRLAEHRALTWCILRPPAVYGPGDRETLPLFQLASGGLGPVLGKSDSRLSVIDVRDLARAIVRLCLESRGVHVTYEIDDGRIGGYAWREIVESAGRAVGRDVRQMRIPHPAAWTLAALGDLSRVGLSANPMLTREKLREVRHPDWVVSDRRIQEELNWRPIIPIDQGFAEAVSWYRAAGWL